MQWISVMFPAASFTTDSHLMMYAARSRTSLPGDSRWYFGGGTSRKSSCSMYSSRPNGIMRVPAVLIFRIVQRGKLFGLPLRDSS